jgi:dienelactone hydrolase
MRWAQPVQEGLRAALVPRRFPGSALSVLSVVLLSLAPPPARGQQAATGLLNDVVFDHYSPLTSNTELVRRLLSPLAAAQIAANLEGSKQRLVEQSIDLSTEKFVVYVPARAPPSGYRLLVFLPPWQDARVPSGWEGVLDDYGTIFVSAARSGNEENVLARREPLALLAAVNLMQRYTVDAAHVYIGGFSGGARIALRLALAYPDLFHGALLDAGSDPLGDPAAGGPPLPPRELLERFQESTRIVYVTGERDTAHLAMDTSSLKSLRGWCIFNVESQTIAGAGHAIATPAALAAALHALLGPLGAGPARLSACRAGIDRDLAAQLGRVESLTAAGKRDEARKLLTGIDLRFGGLAAPRSLELLSKLQ